MDGIYPQISIIRGHLDVLEKLLQKQGIVNHNQAFVTKKPEITERDLIIKCLDAAQANGWDTGFLESLKKQAYSGKSLSPKQIEALEKIKEKLL